MGNGPSKRPFHAEKILGVKCEGDKIITSWGRRMPNQWAFIDSRVTPSEEEIKSYSGTVLKDVCDRWNQFYRESRTPYQRIEGTVLCPSSTEGLGHNHLSSGFHGILYACEIWKPKEILLVGFDSVATGNFTWSLTRGKDYKTYPDHRWDIEHQLLAKVIEEYRVEIHAQV